MDDESQERAELRERVARFKGELRAEEEAGEGAGEEDYEVEQQPKGKALACIEEEDHRKARTRVRAVVLLCCRATFARHSRRDTTHRNRSFGDSALSPTWNRAIMGTCLPLTRTSSPS